MRVNRLLAGLGTAAAALLGGAGGAGAAPIAPGPPSALPAFIGAAAQALPVTPTAVPQNPFLADDPNSNIHNDTWMTDAYRRAGPLGRGLQASSGAMPPALCGSLAFDRAGRIVTVCPSSAAPPQARIVDPATLAVIATLDLPTAPDPPGTRLFQNFTGGGYFFLDDHDRIWSATKTSHLWVVGETAGGRGLVKLRDYDLTSVLRSDERVTSALPDFRGRIWFVSKRHGKVGMLDPRTRRVRALRLGEEIENSFAVGRDGVYIVSDRRMYRFRAGRDGAPRVDWKVKYRNSGQVKPGQVDAGSGTTPTLMRGGYVAITDNADPMHVVVYRTAPRLPRHRHRLVCQVAVFRRGASATENSLITAGRSLVVENNYGYRDPFGPLAGTITEPGFARVDVGADGRACRRVWTNTTERGATVVPKLSTRTGLIYTYTQEPDPAGTQRWSWEALDFRTGRTVWKQLAGTGAAYNNNYAGLALGPDGTAYLGVLGGLVALRDGA
jgi:hypothetical protein